MGGIIFFKYQIDVTVFAMNILSGEIFICQNNFRKGSDRFHRTPSLAASVTVKVRLGKGYKA